MKDEQLTDMINNSFPFLIEEGNELRLLNTITTEEWGIYKFKYNQNNFTWKYNITHNKYIVYNTRIDELLVMNWDDYRSYKGRALTLLDFRSALSLCNL